ncbi:MAG: putative porin, partial [Salegentibacter sp.]
MKNLLFLLVLFFPAFGFAQLQRAGAQGQERTSTEKKDTVKPPITDYRIISVENDTTYVDTNLNIQKEYKFNYLRRDIFELLPFSNSGQTYNSLSHSEDFSELMPQFGASARHYNFFDVEDIYYYRVPTPLTEIYYKTVPEQGQQLDAFFTMNTSENFNFSVAYKGTRALGKYQHILTSTGNFRATVNYQSNNKRYHAKAHFVSQDLMNQENGGLTDQSLEQYIAQEPEFQDRSLLDVNFEDAQSTLYGKRFYLNHSYQLLDSTKVGSMAVGHVLNYSYEKFEFSQEKANTLFGPAFESSGLGDKVRMQSFYNEAFIKYYQKYLGNLKFSAGFDSYNYGYNSVYVRENELIEDRLKGDLFRIGGQYSKEIGGFMLDARGGLNLAGDFTGNFLTATASYAFNEENLIRFGAKQNSRTPNFNFLLYQSDYINYNWRNHFDNITSQNINFELDSKKLLKLRGDLTQIQNYTYFGLNSEGLVQPKQFGSQVRYYKVKAEKGFDFGVFGMYNTVLYQNVLNGADALKLPEVVTRNSIYYQDYWFQRALYLQTGFTLKYFTQY